MDSRDGAFDGLLEGSTLGVPLQSTDGEALGSDEGIILGFTDVEALGSTLGLDEESHLAFRIDLSWVLLLVFLMDHMMVNL